MLVFRDMTFCDYYKECAWGKDCGRALKEDIKKEAEKFGMPVCTFFGKPKCFENKKEERK